MNGIDLFHFMEHTVRLQQELNKVEDVALKMLAGRFICHEDEEGRKWFRCPVHHES